jgi:hypothetical protein
MKTNKDFNLSRMAKTRLALMPQDKRGLWKQFFIESEMAAKMAKFAKVKERSNSNQGESE